MDNKLRSALGANGEMFFEVEFIADELLFYPITGGVAPG